MENREPPLPTPVLSGLADDSLPTGVYFDGFDWEGSAPDAEEMSAEDFLTSLGN